MKEKVSTTRKSTIFQKSKKYGLRKSHEVLYDKVTNLLTERCGYNIKDIHTFQQYTPIQKKKPVCRKFALIKKMMLIYIHRK